ncbi:hypothetical protein [Brevibacterium iodinum]|nr:hypothetical protein [Brevibacterium iodinum]
MTSLTANLTEQNLATHRPTREFSDLLQGPTALAGMVGSGKVEP